MNSLQPEMVRKIAGFLTPGETKLLRETCKTLKNAIPVPPPPSKERGDVVETVRAHPRLLPYFRSRGIIDPNRRSVFTLIHEARIGIPPTGNPPMTSVFDLPDAEIVLREMDTDDAIRLLSWFKDPTFTAQAAINIGDYDLFVRVGGLQQPQITVARSLVQTVSILKPYQVFPPNPNRDWSLYDRDNDVLFEGTDAGYYLINELKYAAECGAMPSDRWPNGHYILSWFDVGRAFATMSDELIELWLRPYSAAPEKLCRTAVKYLLECERIDTAKRILDFYVENVDGEPRISPRPWIVPGRVDRRARLMRALLSEIPVTETIHRLVALLPIEARFSA